MQTAPSPGDSASVDASAELPPPPSGAWVDAVRAERWGDAAQQLDALPEADRSKPALRLVRARVAVARGEHDKAVTLLTGLEAALPLLTSEIVRWRAEAAAVAGPYAEAAQFFARSGHARDLARAAQAFEKAGDAVSARRAVEKAVAAAQRAKSVRDEATARAVRARLAKAAGATQEAVAELRWLVTKAAQTPEGRAAADELGTIDAPMPPKQRLEAANEMIERGAAAMALAELDKLQGEASIPKADLLHTRAAALYKARRWNEAAKVYRDAAAAKSGRESEELFYAAKSLSRADKDDEAIRLYGEVVRRFRKNLWAERASYNAARLQMLNGRYKEAAAAYGRHLADFPKGEARDDAAYERALCLLSGGNPKGAKKALSALSAGAKGDDVQKLRELEGVAALKAGDKDEAVAIWSDVVRKQPLSWAAQTARARLSSVGASVPPLIEPATPKAALPFEVRLPQPAALLSSLGLDGDAEAYLAANEQEAAARYGGRESEALCGMYGLLARAKRRYKVGVAAVGYQTLMRAPSEADRWSWECVYPKPYAPVVATLEQQHELPRGLLWSLMRQESAFDPAIVSPAAAVGLMQLIPSTAKSVAGELGVDYSESMLTSPEANLRMGAFYVKKLAGMFEGSLPLAAASYNAGPRAVSHWLEVGADHEADVWVARIPFDETRNYVAKVMGNLARYQWLEGGDGAVAPVSLALPSKARAPADAY